MDKRHLLRSRTPRLAFALLPILMLAWVPAALGQSPPVLDAIGPKSVNEGQNLTFGVSATDPDADSVILTAENVPANATFTDNGNGTGSFVFDPDYTQSGVYNVRFIASDGALADSELVAVTVTDVNRVPVLAAIGPKSVNEGQNLTFGVSATDPDADSVILTAENVPANATFTDNGNGTGSFVFDPDYTQAGVYNVRFIARDVGLLADSEIVAITVTNVNRAPVLAAIGPKSVNEGQNLTFGVSATDPDADSVILTAENVPLNA
ncbi:MAG: Ig-like domain-containing protein, partial [Candidatus Zixiibacteriota bacterium]